MPYKKITKKYTSSSEWVNTAIPTQDFKADVKSLSGREEDENLKMLTLIYTNNPLYMKPMRGAQIYAQDQSAALNSEF